MIKDLQLNISQPESARRKKPVVKSQLHKFQSHDRNNFLVYFRAKVTFVYSLLQISDYRFPYKIVFVIYPTTPCPGVVLLQVKQQRRIHFLCLLFQAP
jgi:hypothetical protein